VRHRAKELGITLLRQGVRDKRAAYDEIKRSRGLGDHQIAYVGDDIIDLPILRAAGLAVAVADGCAELHEAVDLTTTAAGGRGAVREVAEMLLKSQNKWRGVLNKLLEN
jgi:3-deoxy-D-manno-octulosonate 8-phosphate phosphatase (KDO 8-P phosphatase)